MNKNKCNDNLECRGNCWLNVAGSFDILDVVSNHCSGAREEENLIEDMFHKTKSKYYMLQLNQRLE